MSARAKPPWVKKEKAATLIDALDAAGIRLRHYTLGEQRGACPRCDKSPRDNALAVKINGASCVWYCHRCQGSGGWRAGDVGPGRPEESARVRTSARAKHGSGLSDHGRRMWAEAQPITPGSIAGRYLTGRCCALPTNDVRFHTSTWHPQERRKFPAMVALITDIITCEPISLHFTFLAPNGSGKAAINRPRLYLAGHRKTGGVVRLHGDDEVSQGVIVGEGLETCLTAALEFAPVWACLDAGNLAAFPALPGLSGLTVLVDHDEAGKRAAYELRDRYTGAGIEVVEIMAADAGADLNDLVAA